MPVEVERRGFWHEPGGTPTSKAIALKEWALAAHDILIGVAEEYHAVIHDSELAERVQERAAIRTSHDPNTWFGAMLTPVVHLCHRAGEPPLTSLVVGSRDGLVPGYDDVLSVAGLPPIHDPDAREAHAARARLECYRWAGSAPADGGVPFRPAPPVSAAAPRRTGARRAPAAPRTSTPRRPARSDRPVATCPRCFMALPATGLCDNCD